MLTSVARAVSSSSLVCVSRSVLAVLAERIEDELRLVPQVARVDFWGVQQEVVYVEVDSADWAKIDLTAQGLSDLMEARNIVAPGGEVTTPRGSFAVKPSGEFESVQEINDLVVGRIDGQIPVRLGSVPLRIFRGYEDPAKTKVRYADPDTRGTEGLVLGIAMKDEQNVVTMGANVDTVVSRLKATELPADLELVANAHDGNDTPCSTCEIVA